MSCEFHINKEGKRTRKPQPLWPQSLPSSRLAITMILLSFGSDHGTSVKIRLSCQKEWELPANDLNSDHKTIKATAFF